ncbi:hypothetical protein AtubIFM55763_000702 [Aspergillus tubingensis]|nr:uncharacterized protein AtWU_11484 [Aspergillus tubingensis]GFN21675.1 hypothetical protein AtWU_11484 [Aspergillus tubingensis]GLA66766.1 hypothetical protein AtubIFM54640_009350 [Aspergillus tubingensis]GLA78810.1 hypothetical protein AtubIFM55763_000702 [Aspergillus tubingensis]GLA90383.1 hypothetical protein AtubIFM56815_005948 [Aspergillus tubingensis]GLB01435.1 hypothetical protein AtubIFM57143_011423 [Aspergillus tubingensis]
MPPITRAQAKHKFPDFLPEASRDASPFALRQPHRTGRNTKLVDWIVLNPGTSATYQDPSDPITRLFQPIFEQSDYRYYLTLRRSCPVERPQTEWLMLAWGSADIRNKFINSAEHQSLTEILATWASERLVQVSLIDLSQTLGAAFDHGVFQTQYVGPMEYYELMAVYFPEDLAGTHIKELNRTNPFNLGNLIGSDVYPLAGLTDWQHGWLDRPVLYQGQRTLCLIYFLRWENSDREHEYKNFRVTINGKIIDHWEEFMTPLRQNRMLGYESQHVSLLRQSVGSMLGD